MKTTAVLRALLSVFLIYHLLAVVILPMGTGLIIRETGRYFIAYANQLGLNTTWQFFSPGPSPSFYLEYSYGFDLEDNPDGYETHLMPEKRVGFGWSDFYNRRLFSMRFMALNAGRTERYLAPHLCRLKPEAKTVTLRTLVTKVESVDRAMLGSETQDFTDLAVRSELPQGTYFCGGAE